MAIQLVDLIQVGRQNADSINGDFTELYARLANSGNLLSWTPPVGQVNDAFPPGFSGAVGRLDVTLTGNTNLTGLQPVGDGQTLLISVVAGNFFLTLNALNAASLSANRFRAAGDLSIPLNGTARLTYYGPSVNVSKWVIG